VARNPRADLGASKPATPVMLRTKGTCIYHAVYGLCRDKLVQPFDDLVSAADLAHQYASQNTASGDAALLLKYVDAVKPAKGFRLTNTELNMFAHTRGMLGDIQALGQRVDNGQMLTPEQKTNMLAIIDMSANHAKQMKASLMQKYAGYAGQGGGAPATPGAPTQPGTGGSDPFAAFGGKTR
jgi:hypothetical protein